MSFNWKSGKLTVLALIWLWAQGFLTRAQTSAPTAKNNKSVPSAQDEDARLKKYLDKDGGYRTKDGGYYNPKAALIPIRMASSPTTGAVLPIRTVLIKPSSVIITMRRPELINLPMAV